MIRQRPLSYQQLLEPRALEDIDLLVVHCTELPDLMMAREYGERLLYPLASAGQHPNPRPEANKPGGTGNSGHYYIDRDGSVEQWVDRDRIAHHVRGFNPRSIGVELVNRGRYPRWFHSGSQQMEETYPTRQIDALLQLISQLQGELPNLCWIAGHAELDPECIAAEDDPAVLIHRKLDPGPLFPWPQILANCALQRFTP